MSKPQKLFRARVPELEQFIGRKVNVKNKDGKQVRIRIKTIVGNIGMTLGREVKDRKPQYYEINGEYLLSMLRFHAQMEGATDITEEQFKEFEEMEVWAEASTPNALHEGDPTVKIDPKELKKGKVKLLKETH